MKAEGTLPYLKAATFYIAADGWIDAYLNGIPIIDSVPGTKASKGIYVNPCQLRHICFFKRENILAIVNTNAVKMKPPLNDRIGIAYILRLVFSDGTSMSLSSDAPGSHKSFYIADQDSVEPVGWHYFDFDDGNWAYPQNVGSFIPGIAVLKDPEGGQLVQFLSASQNQDHVQHAGERHLYRRKFFLNITQNPRCDSPIGRTVPQRASVFKAGPPRSLRPQVSTPVPVFTPTATFTFIPVSLVWGTPTALPAPAPPGYSAPPVLLQRRTAVRPTATPDFFFVPRATAEPFTRTAPPTVAPPPTAVPTPSFTPQPVSDEAQTVVFGPDAANIYVTFADGPGRYRVEAMDDKGDHLKFLLDKWEIQGDAWVGWDGRDEKGRDLPAGAYRVVFSKDGKILNKIIVVKAANP